MRNLLASSLVRASVSNRLPLMTLFYPHKDVARVLEGRARCAAQDGEAQGALPKLQPRKEVLRVLAVQRQRNLLGHMNVNP